MTTENETPETVASEIAELEAKIEELKAEETEAPVVEPAPVADLFSAAGIAVQ